MVTHTHTHIYIYIYSCIYITYHYVEIWSFAARNQRPWLQHKTLEGISLPERSTKALQDTWRKAGSQKLLRASLRNQNEQLKGYGCGQRRMSPCQNKLYFEPYPGKWGDFSINPWESDGLTYPTILRRMNRFLLYRFLLHPFLLQRISKCEAVVTHSWL